MPGFFDVDWAEVFVPSKPILETIVRGTCTYLALYIMMRMFRRQSGSIGTADLLVLLLIADAAQNAMADDYKSVTDGIILVATIIFWEYLLDWLGYHVRFLQSVVEPEAIMLVENGQIIERNLARELMTKEELISQLRQRGVEDLAKVRRSFLESDGHVSVILADPSMPAPQSPHRNAATG